MIVLKTKDERSIDISNLNNKKTIYLRVASHDTNFLTGSHSITNQYYYVENGKAYLVRGEDHTFSKAEFEGLRISQLTGDNEYLDSLEHDKHHAAMYLGALAIIAQGAIFGTTPLDWEQVEVSEIPHGNLTLL